MICFKSIPSFGSFNPTALLNLILIRLNERCDLFLHPLITKIVVFFLLILYSIGSRGKIDPSLKVKQVYLYASMGTILYFLNIYFLYGSSLFSSQTADIIYLISNCIAIFWIIKAGQNASRIMFFKNNNDIFNNENETFPQNEDFKENDDSIHFKTLYYYNKKWRDGWVNIINPYRSNMILGTPGSGKSFAILVPAIWQSIWKGYTAYIYDFKYPTR